jgi:hypothetical protein
MDRVRVRVTVRVRVRVRARARVRVRVRVSPWKSSLKTRRSCRFLPPSYLGWG